MIRRSSLLLNIVLRLDRIYGSWGSRVTSTEHCSLPGNLCQAISVKNTPWILAREGVEHETSEVWADVIFSTLGLAGCESLRVGIPETGESKAEAELHRCSLSFGIS